MSLGVNLCVVDLEFLGHPSGLLAAFGCVCCDYVPAVSLAELLTAGMLVSKTAAANLISYVSS
jgi:hypothetical protein